MRGLLLVMCVFPALVTGLAEAADEDAFLRQVQPPSEQALGYGRSAIWTMPLVATQYQPTQPVPAVQAALQAQQEGRFVDAMIQLDQAEKSVTDADSAAQLKLLRASFLLQGNQARQAQEALAPLLNHARYGADARALNAMAWLQQGRTPEALEAAQRAQAPEGGLLPRLALSYALQASGKLAEARDAIHAFNSGKQPATPAQSAIALAREAELSLTLGQNDAASALAGQAHEADATQPYVIAVNGLVYLVEGRARKAKASFETALRRDPKDAKALLGLGLAEVRLGNTQGGLEKLQAANEADPGNALILTYLGRAQQQLGQTDAARASWRSAQQADPKDPIPWLYQAQAELQANQPAAARESLREAQARMANRSVYRGERLLRDDEQQLRANLAEIQRRSGEENLAFRTLADAPGEKNSLTLRNEADLLQGQRFAESARRSLLLQSQFNARPGTLPSELDIYGDGAGQTGASVPQHGVVSGLGSQAGYNNYDELFSQPNKLAADALKGGQQTSDEQVRAGAGGDTLGVSVAQRHFITQGNGPFQNLDNKIMQSMLQWRPAESTEAFISYQSFSSRHGEISCPADPVNCAVVHQYQDDSGIARVGLRHSLDDSSELRALVSRQQTGQIDNWEWASDFLQPPNNTIPTQGLTYGTNQNSSIAHSGELQYRSSGADSLTQWGASAARSALFVPFFGFLPFTNVAQQVYVDRQQALSPAWQLEAGLAWGKNDRLFSPSNTDVGTYLRRWLPKLGLVYTPDEATHVRVAAWKNLDDAAVGNASLAPATLAGIVLNRPGDTYKLVRGMALGADKQLDAAWLLEGQAQRRWTDSPYFNNYQHLSPARVDESRLALHWQPGPLQVTLAYDDELILNDSGLPQPNSLQTQHLRSQQLNLRWLAGERWTANLAWSRNLLNATQQSSDINFNPILLDVRDRFNQTDASLNWQFARSGSVDMGVRNAFNRAILYTELDPLIPRFSNGRLAYARLKLAW